MNKHRLLLPILLIYLVLGCAYAALVPLGEAPDEPAHLSYVRFIAREGRLPANLEERREVGYRSAWPPLYHGLAAGPLALAGDGPPTRLKSVGDTPRRLIPTNGQTIAAMLHTADEAWPWRGLTLGWRLARFFSVGLTLLTVIVTYIIAWRATGRPFVAALAASLHAFSPQVLFIGSSVNDDNLFFLLSGLILLALLTYSQKSWQLGLRHLFILGMLGGLATVTKYNVLPLWGVVLLWSGWLWWKRLEMGGGRRSILALLRGLVPAGLALLAGAVVTGGWWFVFTWRHYNQVESLGWLRGSMVALAAGTSDASLLKLATGGRVVLPSRSNVIEWPITLFQSTWGLFGGGSSLDMPAWIYWLLALACLLALAGGVRFLAAFYSQNRSEAGSLPPAALIFFLVTPLFFLPLPLLRFVLTGGAIAETAQGRHFFPAISAINLGLALGLAALGRPAPDGASRRNGAQPVPTGSLAARLRPADLGRFTPFFFPFLLLCTSIYGLVFILGSYPPLLPVRTAAEAAAAEHEVWAEAAEGVTLVGYELQPLRENILPVTLVWQAETIPGQDYLLELTLSDGEDNVIGGWLGQPLGGRYPARAWDKGDILRHTVPVPLLPGRPTGPARLRLRLLDVFNQPAGPALTLAERLPLPAVPARPAAPVQLRADELAAEAPFSYRSTLSFAWPGSVSADSYLIGPGGREIPPDFIVSGQDGSIAHFIVGADWPSGSYTLTDLPGPEMAAHVSNRLRQFEPPPMDYLVQANFAGYLTLLGYDLPQRQVQPGESFPVTLHWRAEQTIGQNLKVFNHLLDHKGQQRGGADRIPQNYYTTLLWVPGEIVSDTYRVAVSEDAPPGVYWLDVGLYPSDRPTFSLPLSENGQIIERNSVALGPLKIGGPPPGVTVLQAEPQHPLNTSFGQEITLLGFDFTGTGDNPARISREASMGQLKLYWRAEASPAADYTVFVHLLDQQENVAGQADSPPAGGAYPTSLWEAGEIIADERALPALPPGRYSLQVGLYRPGTGERLPAGGAVDGAVRLVELEVD